MFLLGMVIEIVAFFVESKEALDPIGRHPNEDEGKIP